MGVRTGATTRAKTSTSTWAAPARSSARAQVSTVAPEVSTSSISTSRWPAIWAFSLRRHAEGALHVVGPLGLRQADLLRRGAHALEPPCSTGTPLMLGDRAGQRRRLVEAPRPQPPPMQRHRQQRVGVGQQLAAGARHPAAHHRRQIEPVAIFEGQHQRARDVVIAHRGARAVIGRRSRRSPPSTAGRGRDRR